MSFSLLDLIPVAMHFKAEVGGLLKGGAQVTRSLFDNYYEKAQQAFPDIMNKPGCPDANELYALMLSYVGQRINQHNARVSQVPVVNARPVDKIDPKNPKTVIGYLNTRYSEVEKGEKPKLDKKSEKLVEVVLDDEQLKVYKGLVKYPRDMTR